MTGAPTIPLPLRRGGVTLTDRACWGLLGAAMAVSAALILWLNRATTFSIDQWDFVEDSPGLRAIDLLDPHNGHLVATTRLAYKAILETAGTGHLAFRVLGVLALLLAAGTFYALIKRRIGAVAALAPTVVLLFFGSTYHVHQPVGFTNLFSIAAGLGALLALERRDRGGDLAACGLVTLSVATFGTGVAFLAGAGVSVLLRPDRWRRLWIFLVPAALYAAWWVYALPTESPHAPETELSNVLLIPSYVAESLAGALAALAGLNYDFGDPVQGRQLGWGYVLAVLGVVALALRIRRGGVPASLWVALAILLVYWSLLALSVDGFVRPVGALRYLFMAAVGVLLIATAAAAPIRLSGRGLAVLFAVAGFSLATNITHLRQGAAHFRDYSAQAKAQFAALDLARGHVDAGFDPHGEVPEDVSAVSSPAGIYFEVVDRYGSPAFTPAELERQRESIRQVTDRVLAAALGLGLEPAAPDEPLTGCRELRDEEAQGTIELELPIEGAVIRAGGAAPAPAALGRFADQASVELDDLVPGEAAMLRIPPDGAARPWRASISDAPSVTVCPLP